MPNEPGCFVTGIEFSQFAAARSHVWRDIQGIVVCHGIYGTGTIQAIKPRKGYVPLITITFSDGKACTFNPVAFESGKIITVGLPSKLTDSFSAWRAEVDKKLALAAAEEAARIQLRELANRYNVKLAEELAGVTPLTPILLKLDGNEVLDESELLWLEERSINNVLATYHYRRYRNSNDPWALLKACRHLRKSGLPEKCIELSVQLLQSGLYESRVLAAAHTTMGGAYRDLGDLERATTNASQAIGLSPMSFHPYNLLGAVCYEQGNPSEGDKYFERAVELGVHPKTQDYEIRTAFRNSALETKKVIAEYLLKKDSSKYSWVRRHLLTA